MDKEAEQFIERLKSIGPNAGDAAVVEQLYELTDLGEQLADPKLVFPGIFEFLESNPDAELGEPGPLVHFIERSFPGGYEGLLVKSLERSPTRYTLWMANRLLNSDEITLFLRSRLIESLRLAADEARHPAVVCDQAAEYLRYQESRNASPTT